MTTTDAWADRYDRAAGDLLEEPVVAAAQFLRPRGWRQFGRAVACAPASVLAKTTGRAGPVRLPEAYLVAVTDDALHVLQARTEAGSGPVPRAIRPLAAWDRSALEVEVEPADHGLGTRVTVVPADGSPVEPVGPPGELTARVVRALGAEPVEEGLVEGPPPSARTAAAGQPGERGEAARHEPAPDAPAPQAEPVLSAATAAAPDPGAAAVAACEPPHEPAAVAEPAAVP